MTTLHKSLNVYLLLSSYFLITAVNCVEGSYFFYQQPVYPRDCKEVYAQCSSNNSSGVYTIKPDGYPVPFEVYCDNKLPTGGWTVIQRQLDGSLQFNRGWEDYEKGFGFLSSEFYIGNNKLSHLTNQASYELRIDMVLSNRSHFYIGYKRFRINDAWGQYTLVTADEFRGNSSCVATTCPAGMSHGNCTCRTHCGDPDKLTYCYEICEETCIPKGCFVNEANAFILEGEFYSDPECTKMCSCADGILRCNNSYRCDENAVCQSRSQYHRCYCNKGYSGDGVICRSICEENEVYGICRCQKSCSNPDHCSSCNRVKRCYCPNGFYLQGGDCVPQEQCDCYIDGFILPEGSSYSDSACSKRCTCTNGRLSCNNNYECDANAVCENRSDYHKCYCNEGYTGNGVTCQSICTAPEIYGTCTCQKSCANPTGCVSCSRENGCYCPNGFYLQGVDCVQQEQCGCYIDGFILPEGSSYSDSACTKRCSCTSGRLSCNNNYQCDANAVCENRSDYHKCYCNEGFTGNGVTCRSICTAPEIYGTCTCQKSCANPTGCVSCPRGNGCYCPNGFYLQRGNCVPQESCGCFFDGRILTNGETSVNSDCSRRCTCNNNQLNCDSSYRCTSNAGCRVHSGVRQCYCNTGYVGDGVTSCGPYADCNDVKNARQPSGVYSIRPAGWKGSSFNVFCNMSIDGGGWTVIQRRINGAENFYRNWADYKNGFGDVQREFWLGNEKLYHLTQQATYEYRFDFVTVSSNAYHHKYSRFRINNESNKYRVTDVGSQSGIGYTLYNTQNIAFSTYDRDNDGKSASDCAEGHRSGWWHGGYYYYYYYSYCYYYREGSRNRICSYANPNGVYSGGNGQNIYDYYYYYYYYYCNIKYTEMKIRRTS